MHRTLSSIAFVALLALAGMVVVVADARAQAQGQGQGRGHDDRGERSGQREQGFPRSNDARDNNHNSLSDSVRRAQREPGIRVLSAERVPFDGRDINRMKVIDERGRVRYMDDAGGSRRRTPSRGGEGEQAPASARSDNPPQP